MSFDAKVVADSVSPSGIRLTTMLLTYPRFIHAEFMTHRVFSRNAASSRAIPVKKKLERIRINPVEPIEWGSKKAGMQAGAPISKEDEEKAKSYWHGARIAACASAEALDLLNVHKQVANRVLEPWDDMTTLVTSTKWRNFDVLRDHPAADPNIRFLAGLRKEVYNASTPKSLRTGEWHLPFIREDEEFKSLDYAKQVSAGRCARLSYLTHDGVRDPEKDFELFLRLTQRDSPMEPGHWTPLEHQATPLDVTFSIMKVGLNMERCAYCGSVRPPQEKCVLMNSGDPITEHFICMKCALGHISCGNLIGWRQFRKEFPNEDYDA